LQLAILNLTLEILIDYHQHIEKREVKPRERRQDG